MLKQWKSHWPLYLIEAAGLGLFMLSASVFAAWLEFPESVLRQSLENGEVRRALMGAAMGLTAIAIIYSPLGKRSGAHINPAVTIAFWRLGKIGTADALAYILSQSLGGVAGVLLAQVLLGGWIADPHVNFVATVPASARAAEAFLAEALMSGTLFFSILMVSNRPRHNRYTGLVAGLLVGGFIFLEAPLSGMSINPARSLASALPSGVWTHFWIYLLAPPLGMLGAAVFYQWTMAGSHPVLCAKLHHINRFRCIFKCDFPQTGKSASTPSSI